MRPSQWATRVLATAPRLFRSPRASGRAPCIFLLIASRVGHLELIKGSRREVEKEEKAKKQKEKK